MRHTGFEPVLIIKFWNSKYCHTSLTGDTDSSCRDEHGSYSGDATLNACVNWEIFNIHHDDPVYRDLFDISNFPDDSLRSAGNKCR